MKKFSSKQFEGNLQIILVLLFVFINLAYIFDWFGIRSFDLERTRGDCGENYVVCIEKERREI